jgi:NAD-dependent SIR2 family protein deacetylase
MTHRSLSPALIEHVSLLIAEADFILIGAGAGMSADAGIDFVESEDFLRRYPYFRAMGLLTAGHSIGFPWPTKSMEWAFYARHLQEVLFTPPPRPEPYVQLKTITQHADRWVLTSNADDLFPRMGFEPDRLWTRQGTYSRVQCLKPCCEEVWDSAPHVERLLPKVDLVTGELVDRSAVPRCPRCAGHMMLNVRGGRWFVERPYEPQQQAFLEWLGRTKAGRLVIIEVGAGFNTPSVVRWPCESIAAHHQNAHLIRINPHHPETQHPMNGRATCVATGAAKVLRLLAADGG